MMLLTPRRAHGKGRQKGRVSSALDCSETGFEKIAVCDAPV